MEKQSSAFEYLCRVCAANTKGKNSVAECVYILKTPALKDKIEKFLYLTISEDDILPKVLCKACFRQVEATASLSKIAKHTQKVFRDFIFNTKSYLQTENNESITPAVPTMAIPVSVPVAVPVNAPIPIPATDYATAMPPPPEKPKAKIKEKSLASSAESTPPATLPAASTCSHKDEVVVNVSVNDPLTRETQHKMITASRRQNSLDSRFTPKSIAQLCFTSTLKQTESAATTKKQSTPGVLNFFPNRPQQVTTVTSGGYVIGCMPESMPPTNANATNERTPAPVPAPPLAPAPTPVANTLQQKRRNLKTALKNSKSANTGQVSLLKVSQKAVRPKASQPPPKAVIEPPTLLVEDDVPPEPLPQKMIIAGTKQQKHVQQVYVDPQPTQSPPTEPESESQPQTEPTDLSQPSRPNIPDDILLGKVIKDGDLLRLILKALKWPLNKYNMEAQLNRLRNSRFAHIMADRNLLKDADLTQIMGPYLGPVLQAAQMLQQQQIAATAAAAASVAGAKETELQVAGITTSLPYKLPAETSVQLVPASPEAEEETDSTAKASSSNQSLKRNAAKSNRKSAPPKKVRKVTPRGRTASIFSSDEYAALNSTLTSQYLSSKSTPDFHVDLDPSALFTQLGMLSGLSASSSNDALIALLQRQRAALSRLQQQQPQSQQRRQRSNSIITVPATGSDFAFDTDDIILMEPDDCTVNAPTNSQSNVAANAGSATTLLQSDSSNTFPVPQQVSKPMITRPIIKRRRTVIQASPARTNLAINAQEVASASAKPAESVITTAQLATSFINLLPPLTPVTAAVSQRKPSKTQSLDSLNTIATQYPSNIISSGIQVPSNTTTVAAAAAPPPPPPPPPAAAIVTKATETALIPTASAATSVSSLAAGTAASNVSAVNIVTAAVAAKSSTRSSSASNRQSSSKSALGQQLLEAIGLQKLAAETPVVPAAAADTRGSVQQIRSALKKSLQKAQEQQQQRNKKATPAAIVEENAERSVNIVTEVVMQPRVKHASNTPVGQLDVEEEINKITLVLQSKVMDDKKIGEADRRLTAAAATRIPGIRRKIVPTARNRRSTVTLVADEIVDLVADEDNADHVDDAADGKTADKEKEKETPKSAKEQPTTYLNAASLATLQRSQKDTKTVTPARKRAQKITQEESDDEDDRPLKPRTEKRADDNKQETASRNSTPTPRQRSRPPPTNGRNAPSERDFEKESDDTASMKNDTESITSSVVGSRPSRVSKTMSRYYKGPDKSPGPSRTMSTRSSRARN